MSRCEARIVLPWPLAKLSPNEHEGWRSKDGARKLAIQIGFTEARNQAPLEWLSLRPQLRGRLSIALEIYPPDRAGYDWDNMVTRLKYYQDGVCKALGVNDNQIRFATVEMKDDIVPGGAVIITLRRV